MNMISSDVACDMRCVIWMRTWAYYLCGTTSVLCALPGGRGCGCYLSNVTSVVQLLVACGPIISMHIIQLLTQHVCAFFIVFNDFDSFLAWICSKFIEFLIISMNLIRKKRMKWSNSPRIILVIRIDANHLFCLLCMLNRNRIVTYKMWSHIVCKRAHMQPIPIPYHFDSFQSDWIGFVLEYLIK